MAVANVLDAFTALDPTKIISKIKLHLLTHTVEDITAFGPLIEVATEIFECFNAIFHFCSILSNHLSPSCDITLQLADQEALKHCLTDDWWLSSAEGGDWSHAGPGVRRYFKDHGVLQQLIGWSARKDLKPGGLINLFGHSHIANLSIQVQSNLLRYCVQHQYVLCSTWLILMQKRLSTIVITMRMLWRCTASTPYPNYRRNAL